MLILVTLLYNNTLGVSSPSSDGIAKCEVKIGSFKQRGRYTSHQEYNALSYCYVK
jgi:hypothetical protein